MGGGTAAPGRLLATAVTLDGSYNVSFPITEHGSLEVRVRYPGGEAEVTVIVP